MTGTYGERGEDGQTCITLIGETQSPELAKICRKTNYDSDNFYADALLRAMGEAASGIAVYDSCLVAINEVLEDIVQSTDGIIQKDGSGLSRANAVSPEWMARFLAAMQGNKAFVESLPHPGEGTLFNLRNLNPAGFRIKSGSMGGTLCYSGYTLNPDGTPKLCFAVFVNNASARPSHMRPVLENLIQLIGKNLLYL